MSTENGAIETLFYQRSGGARLVFEGEEPSEWVMDATFVPPDDDSWQPPRENVLSQYTPLMRFNFSSIHDPTIQGELSLPTSLMSAELPMVLSGRTVELSFDDDVPMNRGVLWIKRDGFTDYLRSPEGCHEYLIENSGGTVLFYEKAPGRPARDVTVSFVVALPPERDRPSWVSPRSSWREALLVLCRGDVSTAMRRAARSSDVLRSIHSFIQFEPDWAALETALRREIQCHRFRPNPQISIQNYVAEYRKFLGLHALESSENLALPSYADFVTRERPLEKIWDLHIASETYSEDCRLAIGRVVPRSPRHFGDLPGHQPRENRYARTCELYRSIHNIPDSSLLFACWPRMVPAIPPMVSFASGDFDIFGVESDSDGDY